MGIGGRGSRRYSVERDLLKDPAAELELGEEEEEEVLVVLVVVSVI